MTRNKAPHIPPSRDSTNGPSHEATSVVRDGPEGYWERRAMKESVDHKTNAPYVNSSDASLESKGKEFREQSTIQKNFRSSKRTISDSPDELKQNLGLEPLQFGSPFAYLSYQNKHDFFKGLLKEGTRVLFDQVVAEASTLRERLLTGIGHATNGSNGQFCILREWVSSEESNGDGSKLELFCFEPSDNYLKISLGNLIEFISSSGSPSTANENSRDDRLIDVRRSQNSVTGESEYSVMNKDSIHLSINGTVVGSTSIAGPLPDFAVLELERFSFFWWRTATALNYMPNLKRKGLFEDNDKASRKAFKGDANHSLNSQLFPISKNWLDEYRRHIQMCERRPIGHTTLVTHFNPPHECSAKEMVNTDVILAIGAVWLGLSCGKADFAYANSDLFSSARSMRTVGMHVVQGPGHFLMPLLFNEESQTLSLESEDDTAEPPQPVFTVSQRGEEEKSQEDIAAAQKAKRKDPGNKNKSSLSDECQEDQTQEYEGGIGHFVLAIAEKVNRDWPSIIKEVQTKKTLVRLRFMDSSNGKVPKGMIRHVARNVVRNSGWLRDSWPCFDSSEEYWTEVLEQSGNRCGEHAVLNAWAYMLEIPLATARERALGPTFYKEVRRMISLALRGQLDTLTIRAWMQHSKYAVDESLSHLQQSPTASPGSPDKLLNRRTVALNEIAFNTIVNDMYTREQSVSQDHATLWGDIDIQANDGPNQLSGDAHGFTIEDTLSTSSQASIAMSTSSIDTSASSAGPENRSSLLQASHPSPKSWKESLIRGLAYHKALKAQNPRKTNGALKEATTIKKSSNLADYDVVLGIAPVWEGLQRLGRAEFDFTYAGMDIFSPGGGQQGVGAVGGWSRFIMPLFFSPADAEALEDHGKGRYRNTVGHLLLCVAELVNDRPMTVQIEIFDSAPGTVTFENIAQKAGAVIDGSGWLGTIEPGTAIEYKHFIGRPVPEQVGVHTCGLHTILNAWATMLGIPIYPYNQRCGRSSNAVSDTNDDEFLTQGLEIVNLALEGFMDSATIQAFFNVYGYTLQRFGDPARSVIPVNAVGMNQEKLRRTLKKRHATRKLALAGADDATFDDATMARLRDGGMTDDQAWKAMVITGGPWEKAFHWHFGQEVAGVLPEPEDALSPKTPDRGRRI